MKRRREHERARGREGGRIDEGREKAERVEEMPDSYELTFTIVGCRVPYLKYFFVQNYKMFSFYPFGISKLGSIWQNIFLVILILFQGDSCFKINNAFLVSKYISQLYHILSGGSTRIGGYSPKPPFNPY